VSYRPDSLLAMCGRYDSHRSTDDLSAYLNADDDTGGAVPGRYNTAPTQPVRIVVYDAESARRSLRAARWGLVPFWAKDPSIGARMINARAESVAEKPAYRSAVRSTRALVPMDGWFEWQVTESGKQPRYLVPADGGLLTAAGLYSYWDGPDGTLCSCTIITTAAVGPLRAVHQRMPLLLAGADRQAWLAGGDATELLTVPPAEELVAGLDIRPIGPAVGSVRNDGPYLLDPVPAAAPATLF